MTYSSFKKGDLFENFIVNNLFKGSEYDLIYRTNSYEQNETRFAEYTLKPDFKFRCKNTQKEFYVEAKYRSGFNVDNKIEVISYAQIERFKIYQKEEKIPIFIAVGYGNAPENPAYISLIPLNKLTYLDLYRSFLRRFDVKKDTVNSASLNLCSDHEKILFEKVKERDVEKKFKGKNKREDSAFFYRNRIKIIVSGIGLLLIGWFLFNVFNVTNFSNASTDSIVLIDDTLRDKTNEYYKTIHSGNIDALENFINPKVDTWYSRTNVSSEEILKDTKAYNKRHPSTSTDIQWDTFKVIPLNDGYTVSYNMIYKLLKENNGKDIIYHLRIHAIWDKNFKLKSMYEEKI